MAEGTTSDPAKLKSAAERQHRQALLQDADLSKVLEGEGGRRFMYRLLHVVCGLESVNFVADDANGRLAAHLDGRRAVAAELKAELFRVCPESYTAMVMERVKSLALERTLAANDAAGTLHPPADGSAS